MGRAGAKERLDQSPVRKAVPTPEAVLRRQDVPTRAALREIQCSVLFHGLDAGIVLPLAHLAWSHTYGRGEVVLNPVGGRSVICLVARGRARLSCHSAAGREITLYELSEGGIFGLVYLGTGVKAHTVLEARVTGTRLYHLPREAMATLMRSHLQVATRVMDLVAAECAETGYRLAESTLYEAPVRLAHELARLASGQRLANTQVDPVVLVNRHDMALLIGTDPERITRLLHEFRDLELIDFKAYQQTVRIRQVKKLAGWEDEGRKG